MMAWIVAASLRFRLLVVPFAAMLMIGGIIQLRDARVDVLPELGPTRVEVQTEALGLSAVEVEQLVTVPLEQDLLNGLAWLDEIHSISIAGLSYIELIFEPGTDVYRARQVVQERLTQAHALPQVSAPPTMLQPLSSTSRVMMVGLTATDVSEIEMSVLARWRIKPRLLGIPGVANVSIWGQRERQLQVLVDPDQLQAHDITLNEVIETTANALWVSPLSFVEASTPGTGGFIDTPNQRLGVRHVLPITTSDDLAKVIVKRPSGDLRLGDVAEVVENHQPLIGDAVVDGGPGLLMVIERFPGANTREVTRQVEAAMEAMRPGLSGIQIDTTVYRSASYLETGLDRLSLALWIGGLLVLLLLALLFFEWRSVLVGAAAIALSLTAAALVLDLRGVTFNVVVLAGLTMAVTVIIGDAIRDLASINDRLREHRASGAGGSMATVIAEACLQLRRPLGWAMLVIVAATAPLLLASGVVGSFLRPLAVSYLLATVASMVVALTVTPALAMLLHDRRRPAGVASLGSSSSRRPPLAEVISRLARSYAEGLSRLVRRSVAVLGGAALVAVAVVAALPLLGSRQLLPAAQDHDLVIAWDAAPGTSQPEMLRITERAIEELRNTAGVRGVGAHVGRAVTSDQVVDTDSSAIWLTIDSAANYPATVDAIKQVVAGYPGIDSVVHTYPEAVLARQRDDIGADVVVRIYGQDLTVLREKAEQVRELVSGVAGTVNPQIDHQPEAPTIQIQVDLAAAQRYGIKPGDVRRAAATLLSGVAVGNLFEEQKVFDVVVWGGPGIRQNVPAIQDLLIDTPSGGHVRLGQVASVSVVASPTAIHHNDVSRYLDVTAQVQGRSASTVANDITDRLQAVAFPTEYHAEVLTAAAQNGTSSARAWWYGLAAAVLILLLLQAWLASWRLAAVALVALPVALSGGVLAASLGGFSSLSVLAGLLAVLGLSARDLAVLTRFQRLDRREGETLESAVLRAAPQHLTTVVGSAVAVGLALVGLLLLGNAPGLELVRPMTIVILAGLVTSVLVSLFLLPILYLRVRAHTGSATSEPHPTPTEA